jgi:hypothetical protein
MPLRGLAAAFVELLDAELLDALLRAETKLLLTSISTGNP